MKKTLEYISLIVGFIVFLVFAASQASWNNNFSSCSEKALYFYDHQQYDKAVPYLKNVLALKPDTQGVQSMIGYCFLKDHRYQEAVNAYQKAISDNVKSNGLIFYDVSEDHYYLGEALLEMGNRKGACTEWQEVINTTKDHYLINQAKASIAATKSFRLG